MLIKLKLTYVKFIIKTYYINISCFRKAIKQVKFDEVIYLVCGL